MRVTNGARVQFRHDALSPDYVTSFFVSPSVPDAAMTHRNAAPLGTTSAERFSF
jgi:hypothetical protein